MLRPRLVPCLLVHKGSLVKTRRFRDPVYVGDPLNAVRIFNEKQVDELVVLDIDAARTGRPPDPTLIARLAAECRMPLCYGGGVTREDEFERLVGLGVEKVAVSSAAVADPALLARAAERVGRQSVVVVIDVARRAADRRPVVVTHNATIRTVLDPVAWAREAQSLGAGEVVVNAVDRDGEGVGYDLDLLAEIGAGLSVPLTALGGCGSLDDVAALHRRCGPIGAAAGSLFVFQGRRRAVLINYPSPETREALARGETTARGAAPAVRRTSEARTLGIDASNLLRGGGRTHLTEMLAAADPAAAGFTRVVVWGRASTLDGLEPASWLERHALPALERGIAVRSRWQRRQLSEEAARAGCDVLLVPGGSYAGTFRPVVAICQNMLPFDADERARYGISLTRLRLAALRWVQTRTFRQADGVIFLSEYARARVSAAVGPMAGLSAVVPHGIRSDFHASPRPPRVIESCTPERPFRLLYVSTVDVYKHQWHLLAAVDELRRRTGWPLALDLVGPAYAPALRRLERARQQHDPAGDWVRYHGPIAHRRLPDLLAQADLALFGSTCENLPNIVMEYMAAALPIVSSDRGPLRDLLQDAAEYFDPEAPVQAARILEHVVRHPARRAALASAASTRAQDFSWERTAELTFSFLRDVLRGGHR